MTSQGDSQKELEAANQQATRHDDLGALAEAAKTLQETPAELQTTVAKDGFFEIPIKALAGTGIPGAGRAEALKEAHQI